MEQHDGSLTDMISQYDFVKEKSTQFVHEGNENRFGILWSRLCRLARLPYTCPVLWSVPVVNMGWKNSVLWQGTVLSMVSGNQERNRRGLQRVPVVGVQQVALVF